MNNNGGSQMVVVLKTKPMSYLVVGLFEHFVGHLLNLYL